MDFFTSWCSHGVLYKHVPSHYNFLITKSILKYLLQFVLEKAAQTLNENTDDKLSKLNMVPPIFASWKVYVYLFFFNFSSLATVDLFCA